MTPHQQSLPLYTCPCGKQECGVRYGLCHCGCGKQTIPAPYNDKRRGYVKGVPIKFIHGHNALQERVDTSHEQPFWYKGDLCRRLPLTQCQFAIILAIHYDWLMQWRWFADYNKLIKGYYALRMESGKKIRLHRFILGLPSRDIRKGDHENGDTLDYRLNNLRPASSAENARNRWKPSNNTSGYIGVSFHKKKGRFVAYIMVDGKLKILGYFDTAE